MVLNPIPDADSYPESVDSLTAGISGPGFDGAHPGAINDPLSMHVAGAGRWGDPSDPPFEVDPGAELARSGYDYSAGILVGVPFNEADAVPGMVHPDLVMLRTVGISPATYQAPQEATHRRFEPPFVVAVNQSSAGFTLIAPPTKGLHYIKVLGAYLSLDAAGTIKFVQGDSGGISTADMTGAIGMGGASAQTMLLPTAEISNPWLFTSPDQALGIFTVTGKAQGWVVCCNSPYDS